MHDSSFNHMRAVVDAYITDQDRLQVADIGSYDVNGSYRPLFDRQGWTYIGVDQAAGPNVDAVLDMPYILPFPDNSLDVIVSGQAFEHVEFFWLLFEEMARCLKSGGYIFLIAPSKGPEHRYPVDCWRFYPDGYRAVGKWGGLTLIDVQTDLEDPASEWGDTIGVFRKPSAWKPWNPLRDRLADLSEELDRVTRERDLVRADLSEELDRVTRERDLVRADLSEELDRATRERDLVRADLSEELDRVTRERDLVLQSTSWKSTAPVRAAVTWVRQVLGNLR